jgi:hypothetical protein
MIKGEWKGGGFGGKKEKKQKRRNRLCFEIKEFL